MTTFYTRVPEWVTYSGMTDRAHRIYTVLMSHIHRDSGTGMTGVITQADLAAAVGLKSNPERIGRFVAELETLGAAFAVEGWDEVRKIPATRYIVAFDPPPGYEGHRARQGWQSERRQARTVRIAGQRVKAAQRQERKDRAAAEAAAEFLGLTVAGFGTLILAGPAPRKIAGFRTIKIAGLSTDVTTPDVKALEAKTHVVDAVGKSAGGFARAGGGQGAGGESGQGRSGCAASTNQSSPPRTSSPRPPVTRTTPRQEPAGFDEVRACVPAAVAAAGTRLAPMLHRAIVDLLTGTGGVPRRSPVQVADRINRRWFGERAEQRSAAGYRGCDRCTEAGCTAPRQSPDNVDGCDRVKSPSAWLAAAILWQDCPDASCEDGTLIGTAEPCRACRMRARDHALAEEAAAKVAAQLAEQQARREAAAAEERAAKEAAAREEYRFRMDLAQTGVHGEMLDYHVARHMAAWRALNDPRPAGAWPVPASGWQASEWQAPAAEDEPAAGGYQSEPVTVGAIAAARAALAAHREAVQADRAA
ncbi:hypothetical protein [Streptomyces sp. NBC_01207]|uniref:hypothetical protein n=1 Tax=Streptomyces sp. NBC_01207 TaxID=2903772 RepID=UPI002E1006BA|nr:hypothetical protein OG457_27235 [Streptomyces sp. NBC_01207]